MGHAAVSSRLIAKIVLVAAAVIGALYVLYEIRTIISLLLMAAFLALAIAPAVTWLNKRRIPRGAAILLVYLGFGGVIFGIGLLLVPPLVDGVETLSRDFPSDLEDLRKNDTFRDYDDDYQIIEKLQEQIDELPSRLDDAAGTLQDVTVGVFSSFVQLLAILTITFFLVLEGHRILGFAYSQMKPERERRMRKIADDVSAAISGYVFGNFIISVLAGLVTYATLSLLGVPFAVPLAILFAFLDLIPLVGATLGAILVGIVVAFFDFPGDLIIWVIVTVAYQQFENYLVQPYVYGRAVRVHPLIVIVAILIGASLGGILGALVAIPVAASIQSVIRDYWMFHEESLEKMVSGEGRESGSGAPPGPDGPAAPA